MKLEELINQLQRPTAYPYAVDQVEVRQTHISVVFLAGPWAYKVKKPVAFSFVDFSTLEKRRYYCEREVILNRRLAPLVYQGVVPIVETSRGLAVEQDGSVIEWAVKMTRLPEEATLEWQLQHGSVPAEVLMKLGKRIAQFHAEAERGDHLGRFATADSISKLSQENLEVARQQIGYTISEAVWQRLNRRSADWLGRLTPVFNERVRQGKPCDTHGDLRLEHIYLFPDQPPPGDIVILDCVEFNDGFRYADPVADVAFVVMDLLYEERSDLAVVLTNSYFEASNDPEGRQILPWYVSYRAAVRGKVRSLMAEEPEVAPETRRRARQEAKRYWMIAWQVLESPENRPILILVGGLPGVGKSLVSQALAERYRAVWLRSDVIRKELAGLRPDTPAAADHSQGIYTPEWTHRTYSEMLGRAESLLGIGQRVIVDATFSQEHYRSEFLQLARRRAVPAILLLCEAPPEVVRQRLGQRTGDASDATWPVYELLAAHFQPLAPATQSRCRILRTDRPQEAVIAEATQIVDQTLRNWFLLD